MNRTTTNRCELYSLRYKYNPPNSPYQGILSVGNRGYNSLPHSHGYKQTHTRKFMLQKSRLRKSYDSGMTLWRHGSNKVGCQNRGLARIDADCKRRGWKPLPQDEPPIGEFYNSA